MVVTQDKPLANAFRQLAGGAFPPVVETYERGKTIFSQAILPSGFTFF